MQREENSKWLSGLDRDGLLLILWDLMSVRYVAREGLDLERIEEEGRMVGTACLCTCCIYIGGEGGRAGSETCVFATPAYMHDLAYLPPVAMTIFSVCVWLLWAFCPDSVSVYILLTLFSSFNLPAWVHALASLSPAMHFQTPILSASLCLSLPVLHAAPSLASFSCNNSNIILSPIL